jgi:hypothetical protein
LAGVAKKFVETFPEIRSLTTDYPNITDRGAHAVRSRKLSEFACWLRRLAKTISLSEGENSKQKETKERKILDLD